MTQSDRKITKLHGSFMGRAASFILYSEPLSGLLSDWAVGIEAHQARAGLLWS